VELADEVVPPELLPPVLLVPEDVPEELHPLNAAITSAANEARLNKI
jgi:hypothetical protein